MSISKKSISQEYGLNNIDETRKYFIEKINQNELMSKKNKKNCRVLNSIEQLLDVLPFLLLPL